MSPRARRVEVWAALRSLVQRGLAELIERWCAHVALMAETLKSAGFAVLNDVVLNKVLVSFDSDEITRRVVKEVQDEGAYWCRGTVWHGRAAMRISVSSWATTVRERDRAAAAIVCIARTASCASNNIVV